MGKLLAGALVIAMVACACGSPGASLAPSSPGAEAASPVHEPSTPPTATATPPGRSPAPSLVAPTGEVVRYELPNLGVAVAVPTSFGVRTGTVDTLPSVSPAEGIDVADYMGQLRLSPLLVSAVGGLGLAGYSDGGSTLLTVAATQSDDLPFDLMVPAGRAYIYPEQTPGDGPDTISAYVDLPADDFMLGIRARSSERDADELEGIVRAMIESVEVLGAPATTQAASGVGTGAEVDPLFDAWIPDMLGDLPVAVSAFSGRYALVHPIFDGRTPSPLALLCVELARNADEVSFVAAPIGDSAGPATLGGCRVRGATTDSWLPLLASGIERVGGPLAAFKVPGAEVPTRIVVAGQALLFVRADTDGLADALLADLPAEGIPADAPMSQD